LARLVLRTNYLFAEPVRVGGMPSVSNGRDNSRIVNLHSRGRPAESAPLSCGIIVGEARLLGSLVRNGKVVDYYQIDDGEKVSYVYSERSERNDE